MLQYDSKTAAVNVLLADHDVQMPGPARYPTCAALHVALMMMMCAMG